MARFCCFGLARLCLAVGMMLCLNAPPASAGRFQSAPKNGVPDVYTVVLVEGVASKPRGPRQDLPKVAQVAQELGRAYGGRVEEVWEHALQGFVIRMPEARARRLAEDPRVRAVEQDFSFSAPVGDCYNKTPAPNTRPLPSNTFSPQTLSCADPDPLNDPSPTGPPLCVDNWGLDRIDQTSQSRNSLYYFTNNGRNPSTTVHIYVMDSGILASHREFLDASGTSRVTGGVDARFNPPAPGTPLNTNDCHGHGTHVAGIIAGRTYGVAKDAILHPVRIIGRDPRQEVPTPMCPLVPEPGLFRTRVVRGLNWISAHVQEQRAAGQTWPAVINWSGGNDQDIIGNTDVQTAVEDVLDQGIVLVQAAGNQSPDYDPARPLYFRDACDWSFGEKYPGVIVVGGLDEYDGRWTRRPLDPDDGVLCSNPYPPDPNTTVPDCGSNVGACIDVWAPAAHVVSSNMSGDDLSCRLSGTSMAAPHVTGVVALYLEDHPNATISEVEQALRSRGTWNALEDGATDPSSIGPASDNVVVYADTLSLGSDLPPVATYSVTCRGRTCDFDATASSDDFGITSRLWQFGDGLSGSGTLVQHVFPANFSGRVTLAVTDGLNHTDHFSRVVMVNDNAPPVASFTSSCAGRTCTFNASGSSDDQGIASWTWTFGDGTGTSGQVVTHQYADNSGTSFEVKLTVTDSAGQTDDEPRTIAVPPAARFTFSCLGLSCAFDASGSTAGAASYLWSFGDASPNGSGVTTSHVYSSAATYTATLTVTDAGGSSSTSRVINITSENHTLAAPESYVALPPCRLFDTRSSDPVLAAGGILTSGQTRELQVTNNRCDIPADAKAVAINVTALSATGNGNLQLYPGNLPGGVTATSSLNFGTSNRANNAILRLATNGAGTLMVKPFVANAGQVHMVVDVSGYFTESVAPAPGSLGPLGFQLLDPCRIFDSRSSSPLNGATVYTQTVQGGSCGVPTDAEAASLLLTVSQPSANGNALVFPNGIAVPASSTMNFLAGTSLLTNSAITRLADGTPDLAFRYSTAGATTHVVIDTNGYFKAGAPLRYRPITPCRVIDTRSASQGAPVLSDGVPRFFQVQGNCGVPVGAKAVFLNLASFTPTANGSITSFAAGSAASSIPTVNFAASDPAALGNGAIVPLGTTLGQDLALLANIPGGSVHAIVDVFGYFENDAAPSAAFTFTCSGLTCSFDGTPSSDNVGIAGYSWSFGDSTTGAGATPSHTFTQGSYTVTLTVTDAFGQQASRSRVVSVSGDNLPAESFFALPPCRLLDTRNADAGGALTSGEVRSIPMTGCGVPATARAVAVNLTAISATNRGNLQFYPGDQTGGLTPTANLNFSTSNRANNAILRLGSDGAVKVNPSVNGAGTVHLIVDVNGYFSDATLPEAGATGPLGYATMTPCRAAAGARVTGGTPATLTVQGGGCLVPAGAAAIFHNLTALSPTANGNLLAYANGPQPPTSTINLLSGLPELSNGAITSLSTATPDLAVRYSAAAPSYADIHLDIHGYFKADALLKYHPILPCRALDTRSSAQGGPALAGSRSFQIQGNCGVPVGAKAVFANVTTWQPTSSGTLFAFPSNTSPTFGAVSMNVSEPVLGNGMIVPLSSDPNDLTLSIAPSGGSVNVLVDVFGYFQ